MQHCRITSSTAINTCASTSSSSPRICTTTNNTTSSQITLTTQNIQQPSFVICSSNDTTLIPAAKSYTLTTKPIADDVNTITLSDSSSCEDISNIGRTNVNECPSSASSSLKNDPLSPSVSNILEDNTYPPPTSLNNDPPSPLSPSSSSSLSDFPSLSPYASSSSTTVHPNPLITDPPTSLSQLPPPPPTACSSGKEVITNPSAYPYFSSSSASPTSTNSNESSPPSGNKTEGIIAAEKPTRVCSPQSDTSNKNIEPSNIIEDSTSEVDAYKTNNSENIDKRSVPATTTLVPTSGVDNAVTPVVATSPLPSSLASLTALSSMSFNLSSSNGNSRESTHAKIDCDQHIRVLTPLEIMQTLPVLHHQDFPPNNTSSPATISTIATNSEGAISQNLPQVQSIPRQHQNLVTIYPYSQGSNRGSFQQQRVALVSQQLPPAISTTKITGSGKPKSIFIPSVSLPADTSLIPCTHVPSRTPSPSAEIETNRSGSQSSSPSSSIMLPSGNVLSVHSPLITINANVIDSTICTLSSPSTTLCTTSPSVTSLSPSPTDTSLVTNTNPTTSTSSESSPQPGSLVSTFYYCQQ